MKKNWNVSFFKNFYLSVSEYMLKLFLLLLIFFWWYLQEDITSNKSIFIIIL